MKTSLAMMLMRSPIAMACATGGNINKINNNDCPVILDMDFTTVATSPYTSSVGITQGTVHGSLQNPYNGITSNGVFASSGSQETISFDFTVNSGTTINLEGIQLLGYWSTEGTASSAWDRFDISLSVNGMVVADSAINTDTNSTYAETGGQTVSIAIRDKGFAPPPASGSNVIAIDGIQIHGCVVPEPSSTLLVSLYHSVKGSVGL